MLRLFFIVECGIACYLCAMHVFKVRASSLSPRLPLCQISFLSQPPLLSQPMEKSRILNHPAYLMPWETNCMHFGVRNNTQVAIEQQQWCDADNRAIVQCIGPQTVRTIHQQQTVYLNYKQHFISVPSQRQLNAIHKTTNNERRWL